MGKVLQVRVTATTYNDAEVEKSWPSLWKLIWPEPAAIPRKGVLELAAAVYDAVRAGLIPDHVAGALKAKADQAEALRHAIDKALNDWKPAEADRIIYQLEDTLDELEDIASKF